MTKSLAPDEAAGFFVGFFVSGADCLEAAARDIRNLLRKDFPMTGFLRWLRSIMAAVLNGIAKFAFLLILIFLALFVIGLARGDGLPSNTVLTLDLRQPIADSATSGLSLSGQPQTVMNLVFALD